MKINERMKKALSFLLCVLMLVQYVPTTVFAATTAEDGLCEHHTEHTAECGYVEGEGGCAYHCDICLEQDQADGLTVTIDNGTEVTLSDTNGDGYYEIGTADELYAFAALVKSGSTGINAKLTDNIVVNTGVLTADGKLASDTTGFRAWTPIGNWDNRYYGTFDGQNYTVSGLYFNDSDTYCVGLFGYVTGNGKVQNVGVVNSYFNGNRNVGGVVGYNSGGTVTNCYNTGSVSGSTSKVGGVVGFTYGTVTNCYNTSSISGSTSYVGGVVGCDSGGAVTNCYNTGSVSSLDYVGGVVGYSESGATVTDCYNIGNVSARYYVGGVVGYNGTGINLTNCYNIGSVSGDRYLGGVVGRNRGTVTNSYYDSTVYTGSAIGTSDDAATATDVEGKDTATFESGEVAYLLQGNQTDHIWGQKIDTDDYPVFGGNKVYQVKCADILFYSNENVSYDSHNFVDKTCTRCGTYDFATDDSTGTCLIYTAQDLNAFAEHVNKGNTSANAKLMNDIDATTSAFPMIGTQSNPFQGTFDGNGYTLTLNLSGGNRTAFVSYASGVTIKNLTLDGNLTSSGQYSGSFIGETVSGSSNTIEKCVSNMTLTFTKSGDGTHGGFVGLNHAASLTIQNSAFTGKFVSTVSDSNGGFVGWTDNSCTIQNCYTAADFTGHSSRNNCETFSRNPSKASVTNSYYLNAFGGTDEGTAATATQFASGEIAYKLGEAWGQKIGEDASPVLGGEKVYAVTNCKGETVSYSNNASMTVDHEYGTLISVQPEVHTQTELKAGVDAHYQCSVCQKYFDENKAETTLEDLTGETPVHNYGNWIKTDPEKHWKECECGLKSEEADHSYGTDHLCVCGAEDHTKVYVAQIGDTQYETLQAAIDACTAPGDYTIMLLNKYTEPLDEDVTIKQVEGVNITIDGELNVNGVTSKRKFSGTITIHGNARYNGTETLTIKNIEFTTSEANHYFIDSNSTAPTERYAHNVTVYDCMFKATGNAVKSAVAVRIRQGYNIVIKGVSTARQMATDMHSLFQGYGCTNVTFENVWVKNGKNGISLGTSQNVVVKNCVIEVSGYGIRADGTGTYSTTVKDCTIKAELPIVVRNTTGAYELTLEGTNNLTATNTDGYQIIFTTGDDGTYEKPADIFVLNGADGFKVFPTFSYVAEVVETGKKYESLADAVNSVAKGTTASPTTITLLQDQTISSLMVGYQYPQNIIIDLNGYTLSNNSIVLTSYRSGTTLTVQNGTIKGNASTGSLRATYGGKIVLGENLTVAGAGGSAVLVYVDNGSVEIADENGVTFTGGKQDFKCSTNVNNKLNVAASIGRTYFATLNDAIAAAEDGDTVKVFADIALTKDDSVKNAGGYDVLLDVAGKSVVLDLNGHTISGTCATNQGSMFTVANTAKLTIQDSVGTGKVTYAGNNSTGWIVDLEGELVLESGTLELTGTWSIGYAVDVRPNAWGSDYTAATTFTMNGGKIVSSDGAVRVSSSSYDGYTGVSASFTMNGGTIDAAWDGIFVQQSNATWDVLNVTVKGGTIESDLNPIRIYGPAATGYVNGEDCVKIALSSNATLTYTGDEGRTDWIIDGQIRYGGGATEDQILADTIITIDGEAASIN